MSQEKIVGIDILLEFLEVAINHILYFRKVYPKEIFVQKKIYGIAVHVSEHPEVNEYIKNVLIGIRELIKQDDKNIKAINLIFYNKDKLPIEKFVFDLVKLQSDKTETDPYYIQTEDALRTICLKLSMSETYLKPLPKDSTFTVEIETFECAHISLSENPRCTNFPWIINDDDIEMANKNLLPLKTIKTDCLNLQMYVVEDEENKKEELHESS